MRHLYKILGTILCVFYCASLSAQVRTVTFTGRDWTNHYHIPLHHVTVFNLDQLWEEVLYYPDTTLVLGAVGIEDHELLGMQLMQNVPNPFAGTTEFALVLPEDRDVLLEIYDIGGRLAVSQQFPMLPAGTHLFQATLTSPQTYLLSAKVADGQMTIKMVNEGHGAGNTIRHLGMTNANGDFTLYLKDDKSSSGYPFSVGDEMKYMGYAVINGTSHESNTITCHQFNNESITLQFDVTAPTVTTTAASNVTSTTATSGGNITASGGSPITARGVCWSVSHNPTLSNSHTTNGSGSGSYTSNLTGLASGTTYYVRAYAINGIGTAYGAEKSFTTLSLPTVTTNVVTDITGTTATCGGNVTNSGGGSVTARGVCWSTTQNPTISNSHTTNGTGTGSFTSNITGLSVETTYYVRAYATNSVGTAYGEQRSFTTNNTPTVTTNIVSNITGASATCGGNVTATGGATVTARGVCWNTSQNPTVSNSHTSNGSGTGSFASSITGLSAGTTYYVRAYATNSVGTSYGMQRSFTTNTTPTVTTNTVTNITATSATGGGNVAATGGSAVTARGVCWSTSQNPTINNSHTSDGSGTGSFTSSITGLSNNTTYYVRAYATNNEGTVYGTQNSFKTLNPCPGVNTVADYDGNVYNTVKIGNQCWMAENLRSTHYSNGVSITYKYYPNNSSSNVPVYGYLYSWSTVMNGASSSSTNPSGVQGICPTGWHVPSKSEWTQLTTYLKNQSSYTCGNNSSIVKAMASTFGWESSSTSCAIGNNQSTNNSSGFGSVPAGWYGYYSGANTYNGFGGLSYHWSATADDTSCSYVFMLSSNMSTYWLYSVSSGSSHSVRCIKN